MNYLSVGKSLGNLVENIVAGAVMLVSAIVLFVEMTMTEGCSSTAGALEQALFPKAQQRCSNGSLMFNGGIVGPMIGAAGLLYANAQE